MTGQTETIPQTIIRDACEADIPGLVAIKGPGSAPLHRDRLRDARSPGFRYLVMTTDQVVIGSACLVFKRPAGWSDAGDNSRLPQIVDLQVIEQQRGRGYGSAFVREMVRIAAEGGYRQLYLTVEPRENPRAYSLYLRLGFRQLQAEPYLSSWQFVDSGGILHHGDDWVVDMVFDL